MVPRGMRVLVAIATLGVLAALAAPAHAGLTASLRNRALSGAGTEGPGVYGELDGAFTLGLAGGVGFAGGGTGSTALPLATGQIDLLFLSTAGIKIGYQTYAKDLASGIGMRQHGLFFDVDLRPLFLLLFFTNRFTGNETLDLFLYSIGIEVGFSYERSSIGGPAPTAEGAFGFHVGTGLEVPLWRQGGQGLYLRLQFRADFIRDLQLRPEVGGPIYSLDGLQLSLLLRYRFQFWKNL
jgi:hypothetical protein